MSGWNKGKDKSMFEAGVLTMIGGVIGKTFLALNPSLFFALGGGMIAYEVISNSGKYDRLFRNIGLANKDGDIPIFKKKHKTKYGYQLVFTLPIGLSTDDVSKSKLRIEQYLNKDIKIDYANKLLLIDIYENSLESHYDYNFTKAKKPLELLLGYSLGNKLEVLDLEKAPHLLIAGSTGSGKSTLLRTILTNIILQKSKNIELHLIDLKNFMEFNIFRRCTDIVKSIGKNRDEANKVLRELLREVDRRGDLLFENDCKDIKEYNSKFKQDKLKYKILVIDEYADLQNEKESVELVNELARKARAVGVHLILACQRSSHTVITGDIKANIISVIGLKTIDALNSRIIIDEDGLEKLNTGECIVKHEGKKTKMRAMFLDTDRARELLQPHYTEKDKKSNKQFSKNNTTVFNKKNNSDNGELSDNDINRILEGID